MITEELIKTLLNGKVLTAREIVELGNLDITPRKLANKLSWFRCVHVINDVSPHRYEIKLPMSFTGNIEKVKNILKMELTTGDFVEYDFITNHFISEIQPHDQADNINNVVLEIFCKEQYADLRKIEWLYSYIDLIDENLDNLWSFKYSTCPSGYINWLRKNNLKINHDTMMAYQYLVKYNAIPYQVIQMLSTKVWREDIHLYLIPCNKLFQNINVDKMIRNSVAKYELNIEVFLWGLINTLTKYERNEVEWLNLIDTNRTLGENLHNLKTLLETQKNSLLSKNLQKLNFLNNIEIEDYVIIVPQTAQDLLIEGKNQNNCVGHYYNDSIIDGDNLIYFMRDRANKNRSKITCRYNLEAKATVEHRLANNRSTGFHQDELIEKIDEIINKNLLTF